jgi:acyl-CoA thioesterase FadM
VLAVRTRLTNSQRRTIRFRYEILNQASGEVIATGETTHVICDRQGRPKSLPEKYRKYFAAGHTDDSVHPDGQFNPTSRGDR